MAAQEQKLSAGKSSQIKNDNNNVYKKNKSASFSNLLVYVLCVASFGAAVYSNVRLRTHDDRIRSLEAILLRGGSQWADGVVAKLNRDSDSVNYAKPGDEDSSHRTWPLKDTTLPQEDLVLQRLQHQVAGLQQRLRRDVAQQQLQLIRPQRQISGDCICPAGE